MGKRNVLMRECANVLVVALLLLLSYGAWGQSVDSMGNLSGKGLNAFRGGVTAKKILLPDGFYDITLGGRKYQIWCKGGKMKLWNGSDSVQIVDRNDTVWLRAVISAGSQLNSDWDATGGVTQILHKPIIVDSVQVADSMLVARGLIDDISLTPGPQGPAGSNGTNGATWWTGVGSPSGYGVNSDLYLDTVSGDIYKKTAGSWALTGNIKGPQGATGGQGPTGATGSAGAIWYTASGAPGSGTGANNDLYLNITNGDYYKKAAGSWSLQGNLTGPTGATGPTGPNIVSTSTSTNITGILYGNGSTVAAAVAGNFPTLNQSTTGNAANVTGVVAVANGGTAATTTTSVNTAPITYGVDNTVTASANTLTTTTLNPTVVYSSLTKVGTIATGVWNGTPVAEAYGGTNQTSYTLGDMLYASAANTLSKLAGNTTATKKFIVQTGTGTVSAAPSWGTIAAGDVPTLNQNTTGTASNVTGVVAVANGGTNATTTTSVNTAPITYGADNTVAASANTLTTTTLNPTVVYSSLTKVGTVTTGVWNGTPLTEAYGGTNQTSYVKGDILQATGANTMGKTAIGTSGQLFMVNTGAGTWQSMSGDATIGSTGVVTLTSVATAGATGDGTHSITVTIDVKGRVTSITANDLTTTFAQLSGATFTGAVIIPKFSTNNQTGTTYTLVLTDAGKMVTLSNASAVTVTVPPNSSVAYPTDSYIQFENLGAGKVTFAPGSGVTIGSDNSYLSLTQHKGCYLHKTATNTWELIGGISN